MIVHVILFRPRPDLSPADRSALADAMAGALREIPSIRRVRVGARLTHGRAYEQMMTVDYSHAAMIEFDDEDGLRAYLEHPAHEQLGVRFFNAFAAALMYDYEVIDGEEGIAKLRDR